MVNLYLALGCKTVKGCFSDEIEAFKAYKTAKELHIKELAEKWKDQIDERAYNALMDYKVEITD